MNVMNIGGGNMRLSEKISDESPIAKSNPEMIRSARINADIKEEDIERFYKNYKDWEEGNIPTTWDDLRLIAKFYHKPSFYYLLEKPIKNEYLKDFTIQQLLDEFENEFKEFREELDERLELCSHVELRDL